MADAERIDTTSRFIHASAEAIYRAFADVASWQQWLPPTGMSCEIEQFEFREGGGYRLALVYAHESIAVKSGEHRDVSSGTFASLVPNRRMVQRVQFDSHDAAFAGEMTMDWQLDPEPDGTRVTIRATDVPAGISPGDHKEGMRSTLENLAKYVEANS